MKAIRVSGAKFHCNRLTVVQDIQDYASLICFLDIMDNVVPVVSCSQLFYDKRNAGMHFVA